MSPLGRKIKDNRQEDLGVLGVMFICNEISTAAIKQENKTPEQDRLPWVRSPGPCRSGKGP